MRKRELTSGQDNEQSIQYSRLSDQPTGPQKHDHSEDVDEGRREDAVPHAEQHRLRDEELRLPPRLSILKQNKHY